MIFFLTFSRLGCFSTCYIVLCLCFPNILSVSLDNALLAFLLDWENGLLRLISRQ
jgi:hypothetical protein